MSQTHGEPTCALRAHGSPPGPLRLIHDCADLEPWSAWQVEHLYGPGSQTDLLALRGMHRSARALPGFRLQALLSVDWPASLGGRSDVFVVAHAQGLVASSESEPLVAIDARWGDLLEWLHGDYLLGDLMRLEARVHGKVGALSALDGIVKAPGSSISKGSVKHLRASFPDR